MYKSRIARRQRKGRKNGFWSSVGDGFLAIADGIIFLFEAILFIFKIFKD